VNLATKIPDKKYIFVGRSKTSFTLGLTLIVEEI